MDILRSQFDPNQIVGDLRSNLKGYFIQVRIDDEVPALTTAAFVQSMRPGFKYLEVDQDHSFRNRVDLLKRELNWVKNHRI